MFQISVPKYLNSEFKNNQNIMSDTFRSKLWCMFHFRLQHFGRRYFAMIFFSQNMFKQEFSEEAITLHLIQI